MRVHNKKSLKVIRRELRQSSTFAESLLWEKLRGRKLEGLKFNRQHSIGNYIVDFYCHAILIFLNKLNSENVNSTPFRETIVPL